MPSKEGVRPAVLGTLALGWLWARTVYTCRQCLRLQWSWEIWGVDVGFRIIWCLYLFIYLFAELEIDLRSLHLLGKCSTTWATPYPGLYINWRCELSARRPKRKGIKNYRADLRQEESPTRKEKEKRQKEGMERRMKKKIQLIKRMKIISLKLLGN
jgi:hypothetical protein